MTTPEVFISPDTLTDHKAGIYNCPVATILVHQKYESVCPEQFGDTMPVVYRMPLPYEFMDAPRRFAKWIAKGK